MRLNNILRLLTLLAFALFGGALPVAAQGEHAVICGADGVKRIVAYDFETGQPVEVEIFEPECQDCFGVATILIETPEFAPFNRSRGRYGPMMSLGASPEGLIGLSQARAPPSSII